ncbi:MAG: hypothetical protein ACXV6K_10505 [Halobacteriota archaeon]
MRGGVGCLEVRHRGATFFHICKGAQNIRFPIGQKPVQRMRRDNQVKRVAKPRFRGEKAVLDVDFKGEPLEGVLYLFNVFLDGSMAV